MNQIPFLQEIATVAVAAVLVTVIVGRLRLPTVAGFLLSGALVGPHGINLVDDTHAIETIAEFGVVLLLFTIGLEFSLKRLQHILRRVVVGGVLQVGVTLGLVFLGASALGVRQETAILYGFVFALSSTAIVFRALTDRRELDAPHGRFIVGALIFQDLCIVPMVLLVPLLGGTEESTLSMLGLALGKAVAVVVGVLGFSRFIVPRLLNWVESSRSHEVFMLALLSLCVGTAWLTSLAGLSLALGAFLGGMVVADTQYSHRAIADMLPLRGVFVSFFFVSLGMFFDLGVLAAHPLLVLLLVCGFTFGKGAIAIAAAMVMRFPPRAAWLAGVGLAQFGEFGFVLLRLGTEANIVQQAEVDPLLNAGILSMFLTPLLLQYAPHITAGERLLAPLAKLLRARSIEELDEPGSTLGDHIVVIGYGVAGRLLASALRSLGSTNHVILELNAENVRAGREVGDPVYYADATSEEALGHAHVAQARAVVVMINDPQAAIRVVDVLRRVAPQPTVIVRTHYLADREELLGLGSSSVVVEEVEGGVEILARVMRELDVPRNVIDAEIHRAREGTAVSARGVTVPRNAWGGALPLAGLRVESVVIVAGSIAVSKSLRELDLRAKTGALVVAIQHGDELLLHRPDGVLSPGDVAYLIGETEAVKSAIDLLGQVDDGRESS